MTQIETHPETREVVATLVVDAPAAAVWKAWTTPESIRRWWPFEGMTMPVLENDVREGGAYRYVGRAPDGSEHEFRGGYREVAENRRLVHTETYAPYPDVEILVTVELDERDGKTHVVNRNLFPSAQALQSALGGGMAEGVRGSLDRLAELVAGRELSITRLIDLPRERIFDAWTDPELLKMWWAPRPLATPEVRIDARPGGVFATTMKGPEGEEHAYQGVFLEVVPNERLVFTDAFGPGWTTNPDPFMVGIVTFEEEDGKTRYTARTRHWSVEARERHEAMGFHAGWNQCLDQLVEAVQGQIVQGERVG